MRERPNKTGAGKGAMMVQFHVGRLGRPMPGPLSLECMRNLALAGWLLCAPLLCLGSGCVLFPQRGLVAPSASGEVLDSGTLKPVAGAVVVRQITVGDRATTSRTDESGFFQFERQKGLRWLTGCRAAGPIEYRIVAEGYAHFQTNLYGGGDFYGGSIPHNVGRVLLQREKQ
jgi:hypothetical protein